MLDVEKIAKQALVGIDGIKTVKIGIEPHMSPNDYPIIRIVPDETRPDQSVTDLTRAYFNIYIALADKFDSDGYEAIYDTLAVWEEEVKTILSATEGAAFFWKSTKQDEDRLQNVKAIVLRYEAIG